MTVFSRFLLSLLACLVLGRALDPKPARAAETLTLRLGPLEREVGIGELESYARTGEIPRSLQPYRRILPPAVRDVLAKHLQIDRKLARQFLEDLFQEEEGEKFLAQIETVIPGSSPDILRETFLATLENSEKITVSSFLKAYPAKRVTVDLLTLASIAVRLNRQNLESTLIGSGLRETSPAIAGTPLPSGVVPHEAGRSAVFRGERVFYDPARKRAIRADIYYSIETEGPLVIMSHGFAADRRFLRYLAYHLASHGIPVVSVEHPGSNIDSLARNAAGLTLDRILPAGEFIDRPKDISFVLNELTSLNRDSSEFKGKLPTDRVTIIGHSFGGYTALALAGARLVPRAARAACSGLTPLERSPADWLQCSAAELPYRSMSFRDYRIDRAIVLNPLVGDLFNRDLSSISIPILLLSSTADGITPIVDHQLKPFESLAGEKYLLIADGATHMSATDRIYLDSSLGRSTLVPEVMDDRADPLRKMLAGVSYAFIERSTPRAEIYRPFLSSSYVESFSSDFLRFRLIGNLPAPIVTALSVLSPDRPRVRSDLDLPRPSWLEASWGILNTWFAPTDFRTEKLSAIFGELLHYSDTTFDPWG